VEYSGIIERFIDAFYPGASIAVVAGSTARGERTATSDIDLLIVGGQLFDDQAQASEASTYAFEGNIFEVFAYTEEGFRDWAQRGINQHRPVILHMLLEGTSIRDTGGLVQLRNTWSGIINRGPTLDDKESAARRYFITDALDDLRDAADPLEQRVLASILFERIAELMLLSAGCWIATGKWLPRRLRALSPERADRLTSPLLDDDYETFADRVGEELTLVGGRVQAGFIR